jgi:hypothetical protein
VTDTFAGIDMSKKGRKNGRTSPDERERLCEADNTVADTSARQEEVEEIPRGEIDTHMRVRRIGLT